MDNFAVSLSLGKDSFLAMHKMALAGHEPVCFIVMVREEDRRSFFHGADFQILAAYEQALDIPLIACEGSNDNYARVFEAGLRKAVDLGAENCVFGDMDIAAHRRWQEERCENAGLKAKFPLWQMPRAEVVREVLETGFKCLIKTVNNTLLPELLLGQELSPDTIAIMKKSGPAGSPEGQTTDICGENGEYHTLVTDGPVFKRPVRFNCGEILRFGDYSTIETTLAQPAI